MDLSLIIVNWNTRNLLAQCLGSVYANPPDGEFEVIVVDNGSTDTSASMVREFFPQVCLVENTKNVGFVRANNQALSECHGRYVMLLNSDTIAEPHALAKMVGFLDGNPEAGIVGASIQNLDGTLQRCFGDFPTILTEFVYACGLDSWPSIYRRFGPAPIYSNESRQTDWVLGAALMVRRQVLDRVGYLDEEFFMYSEEIDLCYRVARDGWKNYVLGTAHIIHLGGQSAQQIPAPMKAELFRSKAKYFRKYHGRLVAALVYFVFAVSILARRLVYRLRGRKQMSDIWADVWRYFVRKEQRRSLSPAQP